MDEESHGNNWGFHWVPPLTYALHLRRSSGSKTCLCFVLCPSQLFTDNNVAVVVGGRPGSHQSRQGPQGQLLIWRKVPALNPAGKSLGTEQADAGYGRAMALCTLSWEGSFSGRTGIGTRNGAERLVGATCPWLSPLVCACMRLWSLAGEAQGQEGDLGERCQGGSPGLLQEWMPHLLLTVGRYISLPSHWARHAGRKQLPSEHIPQLRCKYVQCVCRFEGELLLSIPVHCNSLHSGTYGSWLDGLQLVAGP